jgi:hypothetical protein
MHGPAKIDDPFRFLEPSARCVARAMTLSMGESDASSLQP